MRRMNTKYMNAEYKLTRWKSKFKTTKSRRRNTESNLKNARSYAYHFD